MTPEKVFKYGFTPKGSSSNLYEHVTSNASAGNFISTSKHKKIAEGFAGRNGYVYDIETKNGIDVNDILGINSPYPEQFEVSVFGGVSASEIRGAWKMEKGKLVGEYIKNPNFRGK